MQTFTKQKSKVVSKEIKIVAFIIPLYFLKLNKIEHTFRILKSKI